MRAGWTAEQDATLCALYPSAGWADLCAALPGRGKHEIGNLVPACKPCNFAKHDKTPAEWLQVPLHQLVAKEL